MDGSAPRSAREMEEFLEARIAERQQDGASAFPGDDRLTIDDLIEARDAVALWAANDQVGPLRIGEHLLDLLRSTYPPSRAILTPEVASAPPTASSVWLESSPQNGFRDLRGAETLRGLNALRAYLDRTGDAAEPDWRRAATAIDAVRQGAYSVALYDVEPLRSSAEAYCRDLAEVVVDRAARWFGDELMAVRRSVQSAMGGRLSLSSEQQRELRDRLGVLDECARALRSLDLLADEQQAELAEARQNLPRAQWMGDLLALRDRAATVAQFWGDHVDQLRPMYEEIETFPHPELAGYDDLAQLGQRLRELDAEYKRASGVIVSIRRSEDILEKINLLKAQARRTGSLWQDGRDVPIDVALAQAEETARVEATALVQERRSKAQAFWTTEPAHALRILSEAETLEVVQKYLPPSERDVLNLDLQNLRAGSRAWDVAQRYLDESAGTLDLAERVRFLQGAEDAYPQHPALAEAARVARAAWTREVLRGARELLRAITLHLPSQDREKLPAIRDDLAARELELENLGSSGGVDPEVASVARELAGARERVDRRERDLARVEGLIQQLAGLVETGATGRAEEIARQVEAVSLPPGLSPRFEQIRIQLAAQHGTDRLFAEAQRLLQGGQGREALDRADQLVLMAPGSELYRRLQDQCFLSCHRAEADRAFAADDFVQAGHLYRLLVDRGAEVPSYVASRLTEIERTLEREPTAREAMLDAAGFAGVEQWDGAISSLREWRGLRGPLRREIHSLLMSYCRSWEESLLDQATSALGNPDATADDLDRLLAELDDGLRAFTDMAYRTRELPRRRRQIVSAAQLLRARRHAALDPGQALVELNRFLDQLGDASVDPEYQGQTELRIELTRRALLTEVQNLEPERAITRLKEVLAGATVLHFDDEVKVELVQRLLNRGLWDEAKSYAVGISSAQEPRRRALAAVADVHLALAKAAKTFELAIRRGEPTEAYQLAEIDLDGVAPSDPELHELVDRARLDFWKRAVQTLSSAIERVNDDHPAGFEAAIWRLVLASQIVQIADVAPAGALIPPNAARYRDALPELTRAARQQLAGYLQQSAVEPAELPLDLLDPTLQAISGSITLISRLVRLLPDAGAWVGAHLNDLQRDRDQIIRIKTARDGLLGALRQSIERGHPEPLANRLIAIQHSFQNGLTSGTLAALSKCSIPLRDALKNLSDTSKEFLVVLAEANAERDLERAIEHYGEARDLADELQEALGKANRAAVQVGREPGELPALSPRAIGEIEDPILGTVHGYDDLVSLVEFRVRNLRELGRSRGIIADGDGDIRKADVVVRRLVARDASLRELDRLAQDVQRTLSLRTDDLEDFDHALTAGDDGEWSRRYRLSHPEANGIVPILSLPARATLADQTDFRGRLKDTEVKLKLARNPVTADLAELDKQVCQFMLALRDKNRPLNMFISKMEQLDPHFEKLELYQKMARRGK